MNNAEENTPMLKIIAGRHKGRTFTVPSTSETLRPTLGRVRQRIFDLLGPFPSSSWVMDGFSGTGALGLEALSRGAAFVVFVEKDPLEVQRLRKRLAAWQETSCALVVASDFFIYPGPEHPIDIVFLDPPYRKDMFRRLLKHLSRALWTTSKTRVVLELARDEKVTLPPEWILLKERVVGPSHLLILQKKQEE